MTLQDKLELRMLLTKLFDGAQLLDWIDEFNNYLEAKEISIDEENYKKLREEKIKYKEDMYSFPNIRTSYVQSFNGGQSIQSPFSYNKKKP